MGSKVGVASRPVVLMGCVLDVVPPSLVADGVRTKSWPMESSTLKCDTERWGWKFGGCPFDSLSSPGFDLRAGVRLQRPIVRDPCSVLLNIPIRGLDLAPSLIGGRFRAPGVARFVDRVVGRFVLWPARPTGTRILSITIAGTAALGNVGLSIRAELFLRRRHTVDGRKGNEVATDDIMAGSGRLRDSRQVRRGRDGSNVGSRT